MNSMNRYVQLVIVLICCLGLAPKPLSEVISEGFDWTTRRESIKAADGRPLPSRSYLVDIHLRAIQYEMDKFRAVIVKRDRRYLRYLQDIAKNVAYLAKDIPQGYDLGLRKVVTRSELLAGCINMERWMWAEKLLRFNDHDLEVIRLRYAWTGEEINRGIRVYNLVRGSS